MLEEKNQNDGLDRKILQYIEDNIPEYLKEYYRNNIQEITDLVNTKINGILEISHKKISQERGLVLAMEQMQYSHGVSELLYSKYVQLVKDYCPDIKLISVANFHSSGYDFVGNNKKIFWKEILFKGLKPGMKIRRMYRGVVQRKIFIIETITFRGELKLKGVKTPIDPQYAILII